MKIIPSSSLLSKTGYNRYIGSLTTPPCTEGIIWTVYNSKISISAKQVI
jgi:carbonic anhydrase